MEREEHGVATWCGRLLLLAVLLLGVVTMHTLGHAPHTGSPPPAAHAVAANTDTHDSVAFTTPLSATGAPAPDTHHGSGDDDGPPMGPLSVCLAVLGLGATAVALLLTTGPGNRRGAPACRCTGGIRSRRPAPAGRLLLHRLSVLRV